MYGQCADRSLNPSFLPARLLLFIVLVLTFRVIDMAMEQRFSKVLTTSNSCKEPSSQAVANSTAKPKASEPPLLDRVAQEHKNLISAESHMSNTTELTTMSQSPQVPPDVRLRLESLLASLERWGKFQEECTTEISKMLRGPSEPSAVGRNRLPEITTPKMRTATWEAFHRSFDSSETQCTIDVLSDETASFAGDPSALDGAWMPERMRINSARVIFTIKNKFFATEIEHLGPITRPLVIIRPFKRLVYYLNDLKALVGQLEAVLEAETHSKWTDESFMEHFQRLGDRGKALNISSYDEFSLYTKELRCLVDFMDELIEPARKRLGTEIDIVSFSELWFLYPEGTYIFIKGVDAAQKVWRIIQRTGGRREITPKQERLSTHRHTNFVIDCYFVDYNGSQFFPIYGRFEIEPFEGRKTVASLPVVPLRIAEKEGLVDQDATIRRGEVFLQYCTKACHLYYNGWSHHRKPDGKTLQRQLNTKVDSDVMLDFKRAVAENPSLVEKETEASVYRIPDLELNDESLEFDDDSKLDQLLSDELCSSIRVPDSNGMLTSGRECVPILPDRVFGYVLRTRTWGR